MNAVRSQPAIIAQPEIEITWHIDSVLSAIMTHSTTSPDPEAAFVRIVNVADEQDRNGRLTFSSSMSGSPFLVRNQKTGKRLEYSVRISRTTVTCRITLAPGIVWSHGTLTIQKNMVPICATIINALPARKLTELISHPLISNDIEIASVVTTQFSYVIATKQHLCERTITGKYNAKVVREATPSSI